MAEIIEKVKKAWEAINFPDDVDKEYDARCDAAANRFIDRLINFCYMIFFVIAIISIYFLITREIL